MIRHDHFKSMLFYSEELSIADQADLSRHLDGCSDCRDQAAVIAENRERLRSLVRVRPPEELRTAVLNAADRSQDAVGFYLPAVFGLLIVPIVLLTGAAILTFGSSAVWVLGACLFAFGAVTTWYVERRDAFSDLPRPDAPHWLSWSFGRIIAVDLLGTLLGVSVFVGIVLLLVVLGGHRFY